MSFDYGRDDRNGLVVVTFRGEYRFSEGVEVLERLRDEKLGSYRILYDVRGMSGYPTISDLHAYLQHEPASPAQDTPRGRVAVLTIDPEMYNRACMYAAMGRSLLTIEVFRDRQDADRWFAGAPRF